ncbi:MAG: Uma2 family endonuclease [Lewinellaceae bacterium]|nr:Uma2 family endonuclease [Lewinellaceae bacterium]
MNTTVEAEPRLKTYRFKVEDYHRMAEANVFGKGARVELIDGEIIEMSPINSPHADCVDRLNEWFILNFHKKAIIRAQNPITLNEYSEPEPDLALWMRSLVRRCCKGLTSFRRSSLPEICQAYKITPRPGIHAQT